MADAKKLNVVDVPDPQIPAGKNFDVEGAVYEVEVARIEQVYRFAYDESCRRING
jgi:hypothetical protein